MKKLFILLGVGLCFCAGNKALSQVAFRATGAFLWVLTGKKCLFN